MNWYPWIVAAHVIGAFGFVLAHGASVIAAFRMRSDPRPENVTALIGLSGASITVMYPFLLLLLIGGITAGFVGGWWDQLWIWVSIGILVLIFGAMYGFGTPYYIRVRHAVGLSAPQDKDAPPPEAVSADELAALLRSPMPEILALVGGIGLATIVWLMVVKPW